MIVEHESVKCYCQEGTLTFNTKTLDYELQTVKNTF